MASRGHAGGLAADVDGGRGRARRRRLRPDPDRDRRDRAERGRGGRRGRHDGRARGARDGRRGPGDQGRACSRSPTWSSSTRATSRARSGRRPSFGRCWWRRRRGTAAAEPARPRPKRPDVLITTAATGRRRAGAARRARSASRGRAGRGVVGCPPGPRRGPGLGDRRGADAGPVARTRRMRSRRQRSSRTWPRTGSIRTRPPTGCSQGTRPSQERPSPKVSRHPGTSGVPSGGRNGSIGLLEALHTWCGSPEQPIRGWTVPEDSSDGVRPRVGTRSDPSPRRVQR